MTMRPTPPDGLNELLLPIYYNLKHYAREGVVSPLSGSRVGDTLAVLSMLLDRDSIPGCQMFKLPSPVVGKYHSHWSQFVFAYDEETGDFIPMPQAFEWWNKNFPAYSISIQTPSTSGPIGDQGYRVMARSLSRIFKGAT